MSVDEFVNMQKTYADNYMYQESMDMDMDHTLFTMTSKDPASKLKQKRVGAQALESFDEHIYKHSYLGGRQRR